MAREVGVWRMPPIVTDPPTALASAELNVRAVCCGQCWAEDAREGEEHQTRIRNLDAKTTGSRGFRSTTSWLSQALMSSRKKAGPLLYRYVSLSRFLCRAPAGRGADQQHHLGDL